MVILAVAMVIVAVAENAQHAAVDELENGHDVSNGSDHGNDSNHGNGSHDSHDSHQEHHGIHVASIKFDYVKQPLIVSLFMILVVLCKLGQY